MAANGDSSTEGATVLSANGRIVGFTSRASNLRAGDGSTDRAYVRDMKTGKTELMAVKSNGTPATGPTNSPSLSANGRFVAFQGLGDGLPGSGGLVGQVWIHDRKSGKTELVSRTGGDPGNATSSNPSVSGGGRFVVFASFADNLPSGNGSDEFVYVRDTERDKTILASKTTDGDPATATAYGQLASANGRFVVFDSDDADLPGGDGIHMHSYRRDLKKGRTTLIDRNGHGEPSDDGGQNPSLSANGRFAVFTSRATNLPGENGNVQIYLRDIDEATTTLISKDSVGDGADSSCSDPRISAKGKRVAFDSDAADLPGAPGGGTYETYMRNVPKGKTRLVSKASNGDPADDDSYYPSISANGKYVAFDSYADNLPGNPNFSNMLVAGPLR